MLPMMRSAIARDDMGADATPASGSAPGAVGSGGGAAALRRPPSPSLGEADRLPVDDLVEVLGQAVADLTGAIPGSHRPARHALADPGHQPVAIGVLAAVAQR